MPTLMTIEDVLNNTTLRVVLVATGALELTIRTPTGQRGIVLDNQAAGALAFGIEEQLACQAAERVAQADREQTGHER